MFLFFQLTFIYLFSFFSAMAAINHHIEGLQRLILVSAALPEQYSGKCVL